ncbi:MAG: DUF4843 domain-containing protein [Bacteroidales bacterium]|nr:DUF4843 domain-containing protein [Bacteroidales bacterium]
MKLKYIFTILAAAAMFASCNKEDIITYDNNTRYLSFATSEVEVSFSRYPGETTIQYPVVVNSTGYSEKDMAYTISVVADSTTAQSSDYAMPSTFTMPAKAVADTFYVSLNYTEKLDTETMRLGLKIEPNENFLEGATSARMIDIYFNNALAKPSWWTSSVTSYYLGTYSDLKYKYFLQVTKVDLDETASTSVIRHYSLIFKAWLAEQAAAGNTITEANGTPMTVPAGGK